MRKHPFRHQRAGIKADRRGRDQIAPALLPALKAKRTNERNLGYLLSIVQGSSIPDAKIAMIAARKAMAKHDPVFTPIWFATWAGVEPGAAIPALAARLAALNVPDRMGRVADIVVGHDRLEDWVASTTFASATCGRYANRIGQGRFVLDGRLVELTRNEGANQLHGGPQGFDRKVW